MNPCMYVFAVVQIRAISSRGDYSRVASIACSGAATIQERRLFSHLRYSQQMAFRLKLNVQSLVVLSTAYINNTKGLSLAICKRLPFQWKWRLN